ncbi:MAG: RHS repeat-associated core domain-containing protein [candidate division Zixibacteria bacterium]|nr:RHS repeat-associated core domain-containing protein [candidate division Zixibacteria bacterium]
MRDSIYVKLIIGSGAEKKIVHIYDRQGNLTNLKFYPKSTTSTGARAYIYEYDKTGRPASIVRSALSGMPTPDDLHYGTFYYGANGQVNKEIVGSFIASPDGDHDTSQVVTYKYNALDALTDINNPNTIDPLMVGGGNAHPHFGQHIVYDTSASGYYNGRVRYIKSANSSGTRLTHSYLYNYNQLGWLTKADHLGTTSRDFEYFYNYLGNRKKLIKDSTTSISYTYDTARGSSRLKSFTGMGNYQMHYNILGNMIADTSRPLYQMNYEYRNLLANSIIGQIYYGKPYPELTFLYDEASQRIMKRYHYYYLGPCGSIPMMGSINNNFDPDADDSIGFVANKISGEATNTLSSESINDIHPLSSGGGSADTCVKWLTSEENYLYDGNSLLAIFDKDDKVLQSYVVGPMGRVAVYRNNSDTSLYYFLKDHLGSTRVMVNKTGDVAEYVNYEPFGGVMESWVSYNEPLTFTGKQRDVHSTFDYYYFGARYYDYRTGQFSSIDKASQFASGYLYGGNNPIMGIDPNGNLFGIDMGEVFKSIGAIAVWAIGAIIDAIPAAAAYATADVAVSAMSGDTHGLMGKWFSSYAINTATGGWHKLNAAKHLSGSSNLLFKGLGYAMQAGQFAGSAVSTYSTLKAVSMGDWRAAYFNYRLRNIDKFGAEMGFANAYLSLPLMPINDYRPSLPGISTFRDRAALTYKGGFISMPLNALNIGGITLGHNIYINSKYWRESDQSSKDVTMRHEWEHVMQYERYGPEFFGPYFGDKMANSPEGEWEETYWRATNGNRLEYEAYMAGHTEGNMGLVNYYFWPW